MVKTLITNYKRGVVLLAGLTGVVLGLELLMTKLTAIAIDIPMSFHVPSLDNAVWFVAIVVVGMPLVVGYGMVLLERRIR